MTIVTSTQDLKDLCKRWAKAGYITVDTEFVRTRTYYAQLCLIQVADQGEPVAIDALAEGLDLKPLYDLMDKHGVAPDIASSEAV